VINDGCHLCSVYTQIHNLCFIAMLCNRNLILERLYLLFSFLSCDSDTASSFFRVEDRFCTYVERKCFVWQLYTVVISRGNAWECRSG